MEAKSYSFEEIFSISFPKFELDGDLIRVKNSDSGFLGLSTHVAFQLMTLHNMTIHELLAEVERLDHEAKNGLLATRTDLQ